MGSDSGYVLNAEPTDLPNGLDVRAREESWSRGLRDWAGSSAIYETGEELRKIWRG